MFSILREKIMKILTHLIEVNKTSKCDYFPYRQISETEDGKTTINLNKKAFLMKRHILNTQ